MKKMISKIIICLIIITTCFTYFAQGSMATSTLSESSSGKFAIKKLSTHVPQGLCEVVIGSTTYRLITAYNYSNSKNGSILEVYSSSGTYKGYIYLKNTSGSKLTGHVGGITVCKDWIIVVSTTNVYSYKKSALKTAISNISSSPSLKATKQMSYSTSKYGNASFCTTDVDNSVWIGNYSASSSSWAYRFTLNNSTGALTYSNNTMSIPSHVQGMAFTQCGNYVVFASSNGSKGSYVYLYNVNRNSSNRYASKSSLTTYKTIYCGIEGVFFTSDGVLYAAFESAAVGYGYTPSSSSSYKTSSYVRLFPIIFYGSFSKEAIRYSN